MKNNLPIADEIYNKLMDEIAPMPCQQAYAEQLSSIFAYHDRKNMLIDAGFSPDSIPYQGGLVVAPTGQGKTYLLKAAAKILNTNVICLDASSISHEGWKGPSLSQQLLATKHALNDNEKWARSILFLDEFDKIRLYGTEHDQGNVMENILQLYNQGSIAAEGEGRVVEMLDISRFTIILGGAFEGLEKIIERRLNPKQGVGFVNNTSTEKLSKHELLQLVELEDLKEYGFTPEILGRISSVFSIAPMGLEDYRCLLSAEKGSIAYKYNNYFHFAYGIDFSIDESAITYIANKCINSMTGARAVNPLINDIMREAFIMVDRDTTINSIILKANEDKCYLHYEHGKRSHTPFVTKCANPAQKPYLIKGKNTTGLTNNLVNIYKDIQSDFDCLHEFKSFLNLSLLYLNLYTNEDDFCFASLEKLAQNMNKGNDYGKSVFDTIITDSLRYVTKSKQLEQYYEEFNACRNSNTPYRIIRALNCVHSIINNEHNASVIKFQLEPCC